MSSSSGRGQSRIELSTLALALRLTPHEACGRGQADMLVDVVSCHHSTNSLRLLLSGWNAFSPKDISSSPKLPTEAMQPAPCDISVRMGCSSLPQHRWTAFSGEVQWSITSICPPSARSGVPASLRLNCARPETMTSHSLSRSRQIQRERAPILRLPRGSILPIATAHPKSFPCTGPTAQIRELARSAFLSAEATDAHTP